MKANEVFLEYWSNFVVFIIIILGVVIWALVDVLKQNKKNGPPFKDKLFLLSCEEADKCMPVDANNIGARPALHINSAYLKSLERNKDGSVQFGNTYWIILDEEKGLLLSENIVIWYRFDKMLTDKMLTTIRAYLNNVLVYDLFTDEEREMIVDTVIDGDYSYPEKKVKSNDSFTNA